jgi:outer membrane protein assembly factor BamA
VSFVGEGYSERFVRLLLEKNIQPLYEERGHLTVAFPRVGMVPQAAGVTVSVAVDEGPEWTLGKVELSGESIPSDEMHAAGKFPEGRLANWKQIQEGIVAAQAILQRNGYLGVSSQPTRAYHEENHVVDLAIKVNKGKQYLMGALELSGLDPADEVPARQIWQLAQGAPLDPFYVDDYLRSLGKTIKGIKSFARQYRPRNGSDAMDVVIKIMMK